MALWNRNANSHFAARKHPRFHALASRVSCRRVGRHTCVFPFVLRFYPIGSSCESPEQIKCIIRARIVGAWSEKQGKALSDPRWLVRSYSVTFAYRSKAASRMFIGFTMKITERSRQHIIEHEQALCLRRCVNLRLACAAERFIYLVIIWRCGSIQLKSAKYCLSLDRVLTID